MPDNSRAENWLLDLVAEMRYPLCVFTHDEMETLLNRDSHGLNETELIEVLHRLFGEGLLIALRYTPDADEVYFVPTRNEIKWGLYTKNKDDIYYGLTQQGGKIWEARAHPRWDNYVYESYGTDDGEIISPDLNLTRKTFDFYAKRCQNSSRLENQMWEVLSPWEATYWKTLPVGHRVRFDERHFSDEEIERRHEQQTPEEHRRLFAEERQWLQERVSWYTRPW